MIYFVEILYLQVFAELKDLANEITSAETNAHCHWESSFTFTIVAKYFEWSDLSCRCHIDTTEWCNKYLHFTLASELWLNARNFFVLWMVEDDFALDRGEFAFFFLEGRYCFEQCGLCLNIVWCFLVRERIDFHSLMWKRELGFCSPANRKKEPFVLRLFRSYT